MFDPVAELRVSVKELAAEDRAGWDPLARSGRVLDVLDVTERLEAERVRTVAGWWAVEAWAHDGAIKPVRWLTARFPITRPDATTLVKTASVYARHPQIAAALDGGDIAVVHVRLLADAERKRDDVFAACVDALVHAAVDLPTLDEFIAFLDDWKDIVDQGDPGDTPERRLRIRRTYDRHASTELWGPDDDAALLRAALDRHDRPDPTDAPDGQRPKATRDYDTFMDIVRRYLAGELDGDAEPAGGADIVIDPHTTAELTADPNRLDLDAPDPLQQLLAPYLHDHDPGDDCELCDAGERVCRLTTGQRATRAFAAVLFCTGWTRRVIRDPHTGAVLDLGRRQRLFSRSQRRALAHRDHGCVFPGCDRPAHFCDAHHIHPWEDGGLTDLINAVLLCRRHHTLVHKGWDLTRDPTTGIVTVTSPDGRTFTRHPATLRHPGRNTFPPTPARC